MSRYEELKKIMNEGRYFKVVCGAGNEDPGEVRLLSMVYTLAGTTAIDVSANVDIVIAAMKGIDQAYEYAPKLGVNIKHRPFVNVSVGLKGDPHVRKACIDETRCVNCGMCIKSCDQEAIEKGQAKVMVHRCIGCGKCDEVCQYDAVSFFTRKIDYDDILPKCVNAGAETLELHAIIADDEKVLRDWKVVATALPDNFISMCLDRSELSDQHLMKRIEDAREIAGERLVIQADGAPMSGGEDNFNTTLQAVAIADIIRKKLGNIRLLLSGGTNSRTGELAKNCNLKADGVSIGTFARKLIREEIVSDDFERDEEKVKCAVDKARWLIEQNVECLVR